MCGGAGDRNRLIEDDENFEFGMTEEEVSKQERALSKNPFLSLVHSSAALTLSSDDVHQISLRCL